MRYFILETIFSEILNAVRDTFPKDKMSFLTIQNLIHQKLSFMSTVKIQNVVRDILSEVCLFYDILKFSSLISVFSCYLPYQSAVTMELVKTPKRWFVCKTNIRDLSSF